MGLWGMGPSVGAGEIEVKNAESWSARIDEEQQTALIEETIGRAPAPVLKHFINIGNPGVWTITVIANNNSGQTWVDDHYDILFPPGQLSVPGDGIDFNNPQVGPGLPCATIDALTVCVGTWTI